MKKRWIFLTVISVIAILYLSGPLPDKPKWSPAKVVVPADAEALESYIASKEKNHNLRPGNEATIIWADSSKSKTTFSIVYLHGFSASQMEGDPVHGIFAEEFGCNLYLARLSDHGVDTTEQLLYFTSDRFYESAKEALAIGEALGDKVILLSTSTGGTAALVLAAEFPDDVDGLISMSPNIAINNSTAFLLNNHWGLFIARAVKGGKYNDIVMDSLRHQYWNYHYRLEALVQLQEMIEDKMTSATFRKVKAPSLTLYYYKNEQEQDPVVKVSAMLEMHSLLGTTDSLKKAIPVPTSGDHVMGCSLTSKDFSTVSAQIRRFAIEKLKMVPKISPEQK